MFCKKCGFEYVEGLRECPNCQTPNEPLDTTVLRPEERDTFDGLTIEEKSNRAGDNSEEQFHVYDSTEEPKSQPRHVHVSAFGGTGFLWQLLFLLIVLGLVFFVLPIAALIFLIGAAAYFLYAWLFH